MMNALKQTACALLCVFGITQFSNAQATSSGFAIDEGNVVVTPARCFPETCESTVAALTGTFNADINGTDITFSSIDVSVTPNVGFSLPANPNTSSNGTTRQAKFELNGDTLSVKGIVDSRAFDGPLYEYSFTASVSDNFDAHGFFTATQDLRKCVSPLCGGIYVKAVNKRLTQCADGTRKPQCYIGTPNWEKLGFNPFAHAGDTGPFTPILLKGEISALDTKPYGNLGEFTATAAYRPATNNPARGKFVALMNKGIFCITSPCFSTDEFILNTDKTRVISGFDLNPTGASGKDVDAAYNEYGNERPIIAAGYNKRVQELHGVGVSFIANQFYLPISGPKTCDEGYSLVEGKCQTPHGCEAPQLELTAIGGAPMIDPITGEITSSVSYSCVDSCEFPAFESGPASCTVALP
ncbi:DUF6748 domain-containing protein [Saccharophagus degradans]|uniref:DUF6748 domain-containing protein n=1 Tax=Saccharophagus degradans TaxID=86304 RepID=A0AAW7X219_9GAMM|nr:DUF6748 domain-containing protein [Saccharophagus degradans]MDO6421370.1 hypothetical protein [Saccharophagus degradans]MDO6609567.1 hypothetical protein [Saccharophagus degradans]